MIEAVIQVDRRDVELIDALLAVDDLNPERFDAVGIDGGGDMATIVVSVSSAGLTALVAILRARWNRARFVKIEVDGVKVEGVSPDQVESVMNQMLLQRKVPPPSPPDDA